MIYIVLLYVDISTLSKVPYVINLLSILFRSVTNLKIWKMREFHVVFMYYALPLFKIFEKNINSGSDGRGFGHNVLQAMKFLLRGLHLTKGFSNEV